MTRLPSSTVQAPAPWANSPILTRTRLLLLILFLGVLVCVSESLHQRTMSRTFGDIATVREAHELELHQQRIRQQGLLAQSRNQAATLKIQVRELNAEIARLNAELDLARRKLAED